jgi:copper chaperone CopZ
VKTLLVTLAIAAAPLAIAPAAAQTAPVAQQAAQQAAGERITVRVNGLVCDFCARSIEAMLGRRAEVAGVTVDLDQAQVRVVLRPGRTLDDATLRRLVTDSGYAVAGIERQPQ